MTEHLGDTDARLLLALQQGLPIAPAPFAVIGSRLGLSEAEVLQKAGDFVKRGLVRRFGGVFDSRSLGYDSTLCAVDVPADGIDRIAGSLFPHPGITHCYQREGSPSLWFTMTAPADRLAGEIEAIARLVAPCGLLNLPARQTFKIGVVLDVRRHHGTVDESPQKPGRTAAVSGREFDERERALVRALDGNLPVSPDPFAVLAKELKCDHARLLAMLKEWRQSGILRRVGLVPYHRELGFAFNGMCIWKVEPERVGEAGMIVAGAPEVTHCYERVTDQRFPYNLFAMVHAETREQAEEIRTRISAEADLADGRMLVSVREFKKSSPQFFA